MPPFWMAELPPCPLTIQHLEPSALNNAWVVLVFQVPHSCDCGLDARPLTTLVPHLNLGT